MNKEYKIKLDLNKKIYNKKMTFNQFDENVNDFYIEIIKNNEVVKDLDKSIVTLVAIKPNNTVDAQFIEVKEGQIYADLKPSMCDLVGNYQAKAMIVLEGEIVTTDTINYSVNEDKIISKLNEDVVSDERFTLFTDALARLSTIEISEEQRMINEAERILAEENRKIEEAKRVDAELIRQHEEADRSKYDATRESNENIRKQNESIRLANETNRIDEESKRVEEEANRVEAEQLRKDNYNFMTEDEDRRRSEANAHKEAENLRAQAENTRVNEEAKRRTTEQARILAENTRVSNENIRKANETTRQTNETHRVEAETQRQNRYNSFILEAEANANNFENYTNSAKVKEEERKSNELNRKSQEDRRVSNEVERISNENTRKANEKARQNNETTRQNTFANKVNEVDKKIIEINTTKDNFVSSISTKVDNKISEIDNVKDNFVSSVNTKVDSKISELDTAKSDMTTTVSNKVNEVETRFNTLTSSQQQDAEVIDARDGETSLKARLDRDIEKAKEIYVNVEGSNISTDSSSGYAKDVEILGNTIQDASNLADIRSVGDTVEGQELYEIPVVSCGKNLFNKNTCVDGYYLSPDNGETVTANAIWFYTDYIKVKAGVTYRMGTYKKPFDSYYSCLYSNDKTFIKSNIGEAFTPSENGYVRLSGVLEHKHLGQLEEGTVATPYEPYVEDKLTILSPVQLEKVGNVADRIIEKDGVWGIEKNVTAEVQDNVLVNTRTKSEFIPLPHDQQVKLRTFASKTNISFLTEIEGTIKAQVPKSLGATVNTHTEQISNLNKELDRVKKLEESTVSTVTTESDFTTVEATSNGYFEDVKLEGKTLVNLMDGTKTYFNNREIIVVKYKPSMLKPNTEYTIYLIDQNPNLNSSGFFSSVNMTVSTSVDITKPMKLVTKDTINTDINSFYYYIKSEFSGDSSKVPSDLKVVLLEGDHTQNPPSYFEGLKSVGEDTDEIVVSSVNENLVRNCSFHEQNQFNYAIRINDIKRKNLRVSNPFGKKIALVIFNYNTNNWVRDIEVLPNTLINVELNFEECIRFINFPKTVWSGNNDYVSLAKHIIIGTDILSIDKKPLLYYNEETQSWEKPVLREWDSIEKHADGKYYYHQRSGEKVLNGSENWSIHDTSKANCIVLKSEFSGAINFNCVLDKFKNVSGSFLDEECFKFQNNWIYISITKSKLSTQDAQGFKKWLQANNVTVVYQLAQEKVYECTNIDLITYANETNYVVESGAIVPRTTLKVHNNISNVVSLLQKKVSLLESNITSYMITQNRLMLASRYNADTVSFKVDVATLRNSFEYDNDLYELILNNILVGKDNYDREYIENLIIFYWMDFVISDEMHSTLFEIIEEQHNPKIEEETPLI